MFHLPCAKSRWFGGRDPLDRGWTGGEHLRPPHSQLTSSMTKVFLWPIPSLSGLGTWGLEWGASSYWPVEKERNGIYLALALRPHHTAGIICTPVNLSFLDLVKQVFGIILFYT